MADPLTPDNQSEELSLDQLKDAAGGAENYCEVELSGVELKGNVPTLDTGSGHDRLRDHLDTGSGHDRLR